MLHPALPAAVLLSRKTGVIQSFERSVSTLPRYNISGHNGTFCDRKRLSQQAQGHQNGLSFSLAAVLVGVDSGLPAALDWS